MLHSEIFWKKISVFIKGSRIWLLRLSISIDNCVIWKISATSKNTVTRLGGSRLPEWIKSYYDVKYMGGHVEYPKSRRCGINLYDDQLSLYFEKKSFYGDKFEKKPTLIISYQSMINIENMDEKRISALRVVALGLIFVPLAIVGALWKKKHVYTVIQYNDEISERTIILDFGNKIDEAQPLIYHKMLNSKK